MREGPYRLHEGSAPKVFRATPWDVVQHATLTALTGGVSLLLCVGSWDAHGVGVGIWVVAIFIALVAVMLGWVTIEKLRTRIVMDDDGVTEETATRATTLRWSAVKHVEIRTAKRDLVYVLHGPRGQQIHVDEGLRGFAEAQAEIRRRLPELTGRPRRS
ncbi:MAG: hypothetical protein H6719_36735 [Sandaracinaceae bacterium]|nr:hypothetical protein [Sandaracinaceae bacterium]